MNIDLNESDIQCPSCTELFDIDSAAAAPFGVYCPHCGAFVSDAEIEAQTT
jgi:Zn finger protein HypA/HybF involved in hydrogenase expression